MRRRRALRKLQGLQLRRFLEERAGFTGPGASLDEIRAAFEVPMDRKFWMRGLAEVLRLVAAAIAGYAGGGGV